MNKFNLSYFIRVAMVTVTVVALMQELEKPRAERRWHGRVWSFVPYDFRPPTLQRLIEAWWDPYDPHIFLPRAWGVGWSINIYALLESLRLIIRPDVSEESYLMPTDSIRSTLKDYSTRIG